MPVSPDCSNAPFKCAACSGDAWDDDADSLTACACPCHSKSERRLTAWDILGIAPSDKSTQQIIDEERDRP